MLPYWLIFILPALAAIAAAPQLRLRSDGTRITRIEGPWLFVLAGLVIFIGFRFEVGADWRNYFYYLNTATYMDLLEVPINNDPAYWILNIISTSLGWGMTGVNVIGAILFSAGLVIFCQSQPRPWLALACAVPYLLIVVAMGYTRQGIALGLAMIGLVQLNNQSFLRFGLWVLFGALFHKSAVLLIPIAALTVSRNRTLTYALVGVTSVMGYFILLQDGAQSALELYVDDQVASSGALIRLSMNVVPAALFIAYRKRFYLLPAERKLWLMFSMLSIGLFLAYFPTGLSTALDRMALYMIPLQLVLFSHLPDAFGQRGARNQVIIIAILLYYAAVMFVWLNFAFHAHYWLPYQMGFA